LILINLHSLPFSGLTKDINI